LKRGIKQYGYINIYTLCAHNEFIKETKLSS
jgi:hypothetical protein